MPRKSQEVRRVDATSSAKTMTLAEYQAKMEARRLAQVPRRRQRRDPSSFSSSSDSSWEEERRRRRRRHQRKWSGKKRRSDNIEEGGEVGFSCHRPCCCCCYCTPKCKGVFNVGRLVSALLTLALALMFFLTLFTP